MSAADVSATPLDAPPWERLRERLLVRADELAAAGDPDTATALRATVDEWRTRRMLVRLHERIDA